MRFTVSGTWRRRFVEVMWDDGWIQGPRDLLTELHLRAMRDGEFRAGNPIAPEMLIACLRDALDSVDGFAVDDGRPPLEVRRPVPAGRRSA